MKKVILVLFIFFAGILFFSPKSNAQIVVVRPDPPVTVVVKPAAPFPRAIWIEPEWRWNAPTRAYVYVAGHWIKPREHYAWVPGHWMSVPGGFQWVVGHWRRVKY
jgi:hypothetical protein